MNEKKATLKQAVSAELRAVRVMQKENPGTPLSFFLYGFIKAVTPYAGVYLSAQIITELAGNRDPERLWFWVLLTLSVTALLGLLNGVLLRWKTYKSDQIWNTQSKLFADKYLTLDFAALDDPHTHDLRSQIQQNNNSGGFGLPRALWYIEDLTAGIVSILSAIVLTASLFLQLVPESAGAMTMLNSPVCVVGVAALLIGASVVSSFLANKAESVFTDRLEDNNFYNRLFMFFGHTGVRERKRNLDIRIYDQQEVFTHYLKSNSLFTPKGRMDKLFKGPIGLLSAASAVVSVLFIGCVYVFVCLKAWAGAFGVGQIAQYVGAITTLSSGVSALFNGIGGMKNNARFLQTVFEFLDIKSEMYQGSLTTEKRSDRQYEVEFRDVSFKYPYTDTWALRHVNRKFQVGQRLAVVGENGSGKTTFIKLLCRLYDPQEGEILLNGIDIRKYRYGDYMQIFSVAFQDFQLLSQPLGNNVAGAGSYDRDKVTQALQDAGFEDRAKKMGLDTYLYRDFDESGVEVSGGEAQKIAIARALYRDAPFIILDEPTAALDPIAEAEIYEHFGTIAGDRTTICISHRLSSCKFCDEILVFDHGQIVQQGSHEALLNEHAGKYAQLWEAQAQYYTEKSAPAEA